MGSTRLPGKILRALGHRTVLHRVVDRVQAARGIDLVVVATTTSSEDDLTVAEAEVCGAATFRGSEQDVLERYYLCAKQFDADVVIRITSDCPLFDPTVLTQMLVRFEELRVAGSPVDYMSSALVRTFPRGLDAEIFTFAALEQAYKSATKPYEREHVTPFLYQHPDLFKLQGFTNQADLSHHRWTLDTEEDLALITEIYRRLLIDDAEIFSTQAVLNLLAQHPELSELNAHIEQKKLGD